ncbi:MAG TPA: TonB-dependent receptor plug domain-containing protein [Caulobacteraceae bacterium]
MGRVNRWSQRGLARRGLALGTVGLLALAAGAARAAEATADKAETAQDSVVQEVVIHGARDLTGVLQKTDSPTAFGLDKPLVETPRSVTVISDQLLSRYNIKSVYDFTAVAAGTYTGSFFGVPGSLNVRGTIADTYFDGFKEITNFANYPTPVDASSNIEIVRGPASPVFGAGQIGGFLNFIPKSARGADAKFQTGVSGAASFTVGSYNEKEGAGEIGVPLKLGGNDAGLYVFGEIVDSDSFYIGEHPKSQVVQVSFNTDLGPSWTFDATAQYIHSSGYLKNIGWNRVTQDLIDNGNYISGHATSQIVAAGAPFITPGQYFGVTGGSAVQYVLPIYGITGTSNSFTALDPASIKTVKLSPRVTFIDPRYDINNASTPLLYLGLTHTFAGGSALKLESFSQYLSSENYQSYGFATVFRTAVNEERISYHFKHDFSGDFTFQATVGANARFSKAISKSSLNSFVISQDRRDLSVGPTADDRFNDPFLTPGYVWDNNNTSHQTQTAGFLVADAVFFQHLDVTGGVRVEHYSVHSDDIGPSGKGDARGSATPVSYNISVTLTNPIANPYVTYARSKSLNLDQGGALDPSLIKSNTFVGGSSLIEGGIKTSQLNGRLYAAVDYFRQENQYRDILGAILGQRSQGFEGELRYLVTSRLGVTGTVTVQDVRQLASGSGSGAFITLSPALAGVAPQDGFGGFYATNAKFLGLSGGYDLHTVPHATASLFATWDQHGAWGLTGGVVYNSSTGGYLANSIKLPGYALVKVGAYVVVKGVRADFYIDNAFDKRYFMAEYDVDANATVLPGVGREWHLKLSKKF